MKQDFEYRAGEPIADHKGEILFDPLRPCRVWSPDRKWVCTRPVGHVGAHLAAFSPLMLCCDPYYNQPDGTTAHHAPQEPPL